jgi:site-specific recombinase XerD
MEKPKRLREQFREWMVFHHYSPRTIETYIGCVYAFVVWSGKRDPLTLGAKEVNAFLSHLANDHHVTAKTQTQNLCALVRFYDGCLGKPLGDIGKFEYASTPQRLPVVMSKAEVFRVIEAVPPGSLRLMTQLLYGCGLRLMECCRLRVKDLDFARRILNVRAGKGDKDRNVPLPDSIISALQAHLAYNHTRFQSMKWVVNRPGRWSAEGASYSSEHAAKIGSRGSQESGADQADYLPHVPAFLRHAFDRSRHADLRCAKAPRSFAAGNDDDLQSRRNPAGTAHLVAARLPLIFSSVSTSFPPDFRRENGR